MTGTHPDTAAFHDPDRHLFDHVSSTQGEPAVVQ